MADDAEVEQAAVAAGDGAQPPALSKSARKKLQKQERQAERKAARKAAEKERRRADVERRRREWEEALAAAPSDEARAEMVAARRETRRERVGRRAEERGARAERLRRAAEGAGQKVVLDLEFADLMRPNEIHSLTQQVAVEKWRPIFREFLADAETVLDDLDMSKIYIIGGLVDRNRWKGITQKKAAEQGIQSAKLPIGNYLKMSSSQVLTVNQVFEIMLKFVETRDWKTAFFHVIPQRKRGEAEAGDDEAKVSLDGDNDAGEGAANGNLSAEDLKMAMDEVNDDGDEEELEGVEETDQSNMRQCVRPEGAEAGDHSGAVAQATRTPAGVDATPQAEQAKESNNGGED
ncbi:unnamed protein product [Urochloa humidicola]